MKFYLIFIIFICFILASVGNDPYPNNVSDKLEKRAETIETKINQI